MIIIIIFYTFVVFFFFLGFHSKLWSTIAFFCMSVIVQNRIMGCSVQPDEFPSCKLTVAWVEYTTCPSKIGMSRNSARQTRRSRFFFGLLILIISWIRIKGGWGWGYFPYGSLEEKSRDI